MRYCVILENVVVNIILLDIDAQPDYKYPASHDLLIPDYDQQCDIGDIYDPLTGTFTKP